VRRKLLKSGKGARHGGVRLFRRLVFEEEITAIVRLAQQRRYRAAFVNGVGMLVLALAAAGLGLWLGELG